MKTALLCMMFILLTGVAFGETLQISKKEGVGDYLADAKGMTLYVFTKDSPGQSACSGPCVEKWPLLQAETIKAPAGMKSADFATITRADGQKQTTYKGLPLYYFFKDVKAGDVNGQGVNGVWYVAKP